MPVRQNEIRPIKRKESELRADRKGQHHAVHVAVAIPAHAYDMLFERIQNFRRFERIVIFGKRIARAVIQQIAEQDQLLRPLFEETLLQLFAIVRRTVNIRRDHQFFQNHNFSPA